MRITRRTLLNTIAAAASCSVAASGARAASEASGKSSTWPGVGIMKGTSRGYVKTPLGQVHYQRMGSGVPVLLLHQTPWFSVQFSKVIPLLAARGFNALAPDRPGYGMSDAPEFPPSIEQYADDLLPVLDALQIDRAIVVGHHTGSSVAAAFAQRHADRVSRLILDGIPLYTAEERESRLKRPHWDRWLEADGGHLADRFKMRAARRGDAATDGLEGLQWSLISFLLAGEKEWYGHQAAFSYDMEAALKAIRTPTLILSNSGDALHAQTKRAKQLLPNAKYHEFPGGSSQSIFDNPEPWVDVVARFVS